MSDSRLETKSNEVALSTSNSSLEKVLVEINLEEITCPIKFEIFYEPVSINPCGHVFEKDALITLSKCPLCKNEFKDTTPALFAKKMVAKVINDHPELTNQCYFSLKNFVKLLEDDKAIFPDLLIKILRHSNHLNAVSEEKGLEGGTALTFLILNTKGTKLLLKDSQIRANISAEGLNAEIRVEGQFQDTSALYWVATKFTSLLDDQSIISKITTEGLNRIIRTGPRQGLSPLYWITYSCPNVLNNPNIRKMITIQTLNHKVEGNLCVDVISETGFSPLYWLATHLEGRIILHDHEDLRDKITTEGLDTFHSIFGYSVTYLLARNPIGLDILKKDDKLRSKISTESLNRIATGGSIKSDSAIGYLTQYDGIAILDKDLLIRSKISSESLNFPNELGEAPITSLCRSERGKKLLIEDEELANKISATGLNSINCVKSSALFWLFFHPECLIIFERNKKLVNMISAESLNCSHCDDRNPLFYLTKSERGQNLLLNNPCLIQLINLNSINKEIVANLNKHDVGKKLLRLLFNTTDKIIVLINYLGKDNLGAKLINIFSVSGIREIVTDENKLKKLLDQFPSFTESNKFIKEIFDINLNHLCDPHKSGQLNLFFTDPASSNNNPFNLDDPTGDIKLHIFSFLRLNEVAVTKRVSTHFRSLANESEITRAKEQFGLYVHRPIRGIINPRKKLKLN